MVSTFLKVIYGFSCFTVWVSPPSDTDLPPPPEPPPCQGQSRIQGARSISSMAPPTERKASSLERTPLSGGLSGPDDVKGSMDRQARATLEHHRQTQDRLGSMDRADDGRRGHKTGSMETRLESVAADNNTVCSRQCIRWLSGLTADVSINRLALKKLQPITFLLKVKGALPRCTSALIPKVQS